LAGRSIGALVMLFYRLFFAGLPPF